MFHAAWRRNGAKWAAAVAAVSANVSKGADAASNQADKHNHHTKKRILVTGFHDWHQLGGNLWRCRDNPSCRLILGPPSDHPPVVRRGTLVEAVAEVDADFSFHTLPVIWGTSASLDALSYDVIVHLGLGVYDSQDVILVEQGAYNGRRGNDALGHGPLLPAIDSGSPEFQSSSEGMQTRYAALADNLQLPGAFVLREAPARRENSFICNETHWRSLTAQHQARNDLQNESKGTERLRAAYFLHLPYARDDDHRELAAAVAKIIHRIVDIEYAAES